MLVRKILSLPGGLAAVSESQACPFLCGWVSPLAVGVEENKAE